MHPTPPRGACQLPPNHYPLPILQMQQHGGAQQARDQGRRPGRKRHRNNPRLSERARHVRDEEQRREANLLARMVVAEGDKAGSVYELSEYEEEFAG